MLVQRLIEYAENGGVQSLPKYYEEKTVNWVIEVEPDSSSMGRGFVSQPKGSKKIVPFLSRAGTKITPILLYEKAEYALGFALEGAEERELKKAAEKHQSFLDLLAACAEETGNPDVEAIHKALREVDHRALWPQEMKSGDWIAFQVEGRYPHDDPSVQSFWKRYREREKPTGGVAYICIGCGEECIPVARHEMPIPIRGGHSKGAKLISANDRAYFSYGLENSLIAPTCAECAEKYPKSLTQLLTEPNSHLSYGNLTYVFWTKEPVLFSPVGFLNSPDPLEVQELLKSPWTGSCERQIHETDFYAAALSPYISRIVVREWMETTLEQIQANLARWFRHQRVLDRQEQKFYGLYPLAASMYRDAYKEMENNAPLFLLQHALHAKCLPTWIMQKAVLRCKAERKVTAPRAVLLQLCLLQDKKSEEEERMEVEEMRQKPAYLCGVLFAHLEHLQKEAINSNTTLVDRYYGTASTAPASVFGFLVRNAQHHLSKLRRGTKMYPKYVYLNRSIGEVMERLNGWPKLLKPEEQALFALGFYHQQQERYKKSEKQTESEEK